MRSFRLSKSPLWGDHEQPSSFRGSLYVLSFATSIADTRPFYKMQKAVRFPRPLLSLVKVS